jgi:hypothetical protein
MTPKVLINSIKELAPDPLVTPESDPQILGNRPSKPEVRCVHGRSAGSCRATQAHAGCSAGSHAVLDSPSRHTIREVYT